MCHIVRGGQHTAHDAEYSYEYEFCSSQYKIPLDGTSFIAGLYR